MDANTSDGRLSELLETEVAPNSESVRTSVIEKTVNWFEKYLLVLVIGGLIAGIGVASVSQPFIDQVDSLINTFMELYSYVAPIAIFLILTPSLARLFSTHNMGLFGVFVIAWFAGRKVLAGLWAIAFIVIVFRVPLIPQGSTSVGDGITQTLDSLANLALTSSYFWAMYAAITVAIVSTRFESWTNGLERIMNVVELAGSYLIPIMPVFMFAIGAYIYGLPDNVREQIGLTAEGQSVLFNLEIWGWSISPHTSAGMITIYVLGALLTAVACFIWQLVFLVITRSQEPRFSIIGYFTRYWIKVYPLLWATSSEALATPLNLYLTKKYAPWIRSEIRRFTIGVGSYLDINGTLINVFILGAIVMLMLGLQISVIELLMIIPVVFLISYGVPGIPGELVLFAGPIATLLNITDPTLSIFLAVYIGIQLGLPDSFRTGSNSTDDYVQAILMNAVYEQRFAVRTTTAESLEMEVQSAEKG
jgi:Na+/H+-dicarboxylate symporter